MAHPSLAGRARRRCGFALLATAAAALLGGCTQTGLPFSGASLPFSSNEPKLSTTDSAGDVAHWAAAYAKTPNDPKVAIGYAQALKAIGSRDRALKVLTAGYRTNPENGELASELGRLALDMGRLGIASQSLQAAEAKGASDWKTLSAQGTLRANQGNYAEAQQYFLAALKEQPDAVSVINNLALSYALDGKAEKSEELLRKAVASGHDDKRVRQNLALVLGLQGKFEEANKVASIDMTEQATKASLAYLRNMRADTTQLAAATPADGGEDSDWAPFAAAEDTDTGANAAATAVAANVQVVKPAETVEAPASTTVATKRTASAASPAMPQPVTETPTLISPANATPAETSSLGPFRP